MVWLHRAPLRAARPFEQLPHDLSMAGLNCSRHCAGEVIIQVAGKWRRAASLLCGIDKKFGRQAEAAACG
jgi:hypothetical protein